MRKIPTLFLRNPEKMSEVTDEINPEAAWILEEPTTATIKKDGTNVQITVAGNGLLRLVEKRKNPTRKDKERAEANGLPTPEPGYVVARREDSTDKHIFAAVDATDFSEWPEGSWPCEALGPKIQGGVESSVPTLYPFSLWPEEAPFGGPVNFEYETVRQYMRVVAPIEGIAWHSSDGKKMVKIKRKDFGLSWPPKGAPSG